MSRARLYLGIAFAAPVTLLTGLLYLLPFTLLGWYRYIGKRTAPPEKSPLGVGWAFVLVPEKAPAWLNKLWSSWAGHCVGSTVVLKTDPALERPSALGPVTLNHELHHVHQMHKLGFFQPVLYVLASVVAWASKEKPYQANAFECAARRAAGQVVDVDSFVQGYALCKKTSTK